MPQPDLRPTSPLVPDRAAGLAEFDLVERVRAGDAAAFELIMRRHNRRLFRIARSILRNAAEAEDVVQETYVRAFAKLDDFIGPDGFSAWLARIACNEALGRVRGSDRVVSLHDRVGDGDGDADVCRIDTMSSRQPDPEHLTGNGELRRLLEDAIDALPAEFRSVFVLRAVEGMSVAETAEALSIRPETVKTRFHRARSRLQEMLGARFEALMPAAFEFGGARCDRIVAAVLARLGPSLEARRSEPAPGGGAQPSLNRCKARKESIMRNPILSAVAVAAFAMTAACAAQADKALPEGDYQKVSDLVALPEFIPGLGTLYVQPATLPAGPFLAYDRSDQLVSTIYMVPLEDIEAQKSFDDLAVGSETVESVDFYYNAGHPGVETPHYHVVLWHVSEDDADLE